LHDRNGENIGALRVTLKSFFGETQNNALTRALNILKLVELTAAATDDITK